LNFFSDQFLNLEFTLFVKNNIKIQIIQTILGIVILSGPKSINNNVSINKQINTIINNNKSILCIVIF